MVVKIRANDYDPKAVFRIIREWSNMTQKEFGATINKSERTIQNYEGGLANYTVKQLLEMAEKHDIEIIVQKTK